MPKQRVILDLIKTLDDNPYLTTLQLQCSQDLGYRPGSADLSHSSYDELSTTGIRLLEILVLHLLFSETWKR